MLTLREAVKKAVKKRKAYGAPKSSGNKQPRPQYFEVDIHFETIAPYHLKEIVVAETREDAVTLAMKRFRERKEDNNIRTGKRLYDRRLKVQNPFDKSVIKKAKPQLSSVQKEVLQILDKGYKLFPRRNSYSYRLKVKKDDEHDEGWADKQTIDALWRKGFITTPELLMLNDAERRAQTALGTLPTGRILVINKKALAEFQINLYPKKKKGKP